MANVNLSDIKPHIMRTVEEPVEEVSKTAYAIKFGNHVITFRDDTSIEDPCWRNTVIHCTYAVENRRSAPFW